MTERPESSTDQPETGELPELRRRLLAGMLRHAPFDGWSDRALQAAARDEEIAPEMAALAFQGGPSDIADFLTQEADRQMVEAVAAALTEATDSQIRLKIREKVALTVRTRLEQHAGHREALRALASFMALPGHAGLASRSLWRTVDAMWRAIGDTSTDFSYYSKRTLLAGIYASTVLVWLDDHSEGFADSFAFLDRRIDGAMAIERGKARLKRLASDLFGWTSAAVRPSSHDFTRSYAAPVRPRTRPATGPRSGPRV